MYDPAILYLKALTMLFFTVFIVMMSNMGLGITEPLIHAVFGSLCTLTAVFWMFGPDKDDDFDDDEDGLV